MLDDYNATAYLDLEEEDIAVTNIITKYKISSKNNSFLFDVEDDYKSLINYIGELFIKNQTLPDDIKNQLLHNINFRSFLIKNIIIKIDNIFFDKKTIVFKEIVTIINLLSFGKNFNIFENYISYNLDNLSSLFREYEEKLEKNQNIKEEFELLFAHYTLLIEIINVLCKINSSDVQRKKTINPIIEILTETINILKFKISLNEEKVNILNNILGKLLFYYAHIPYIDITNRKLFDVIDEFYFNFEKSIAGYQLSKNTSFGNSNELKEYKLFLNTISTLLSNMIYKLESEYEYNEYKDLALFKNILDLYEEVIVHTNIPKIKTIFELKKHLINNYIFIYSGNCEDSVDIIINDFFSNKQFDNSTIQIIYAITLYSDIKNDTLIEILRKFLSMEKFHNDYLEFYKLNICDVIINKLIRHNNFVLDEELSKILVDYINENSVASHLISIYTKVFLSLSLYYSNFNDFKSIELSKNYYAIYININGYNLLNNEYSSINRKILVNYGKNLIEELEIEVNGVKNDKFYTLGEKSVIKHITQNKINKKFYMNQKLSDLLTKILNEQNLDDEKINSYIEEFISKDIFYGLVFCAVDGLCKNKCEVLDLGYEIIKIPLFKQFTLKIAYSTVYKDVFQNIYLNTKEYIEKNVSNIIITYQKTIPMFFDKVTGLRNVNRLQKDFKKLPNEFIFIEFYLHSIEELNTKFGYAKTNEIFKEYISKIEQITDLYRLSGPKLGIVLPSDFNYKELIMNIEKIVVLSYEEEIKFENTYAITWGNKNNILEKSACCIALARKDGKKSLELK
ncbi:hypothetical protein OZZ08_06365 [Malaciobacter mytili]|uniref:hypothetical protein n=1 Tax=Malaciobacter mytili TaxID=603050 RepID=UPI003BB0D5C5